VSGDAVTVNADSMLLRRLVRNLLVNAQIHAGGATSLLVGRSGRHASLVIEDAGAGVPGADRDKIFETVLPRLHRHAVERRRAWVFLSSDRSHARTVEAWSTHRVPKEAAVSR
jgi:K+-sensing histidine kinase KdpD